MPKTIKNEDGTEEQVFTQEEMDAKAAEVAEAKTAEEREKLEAEKNDALATKEEELKAAQDELAKLKDKDYNFNKVARGKEKKDAEESELKKSIENMQKELDSYRKQPIEDAKDDFIKRHIGDNKELKDKFDVYMGKLGGEVKTKAEAEKVFMDAYMLANDGKKPDVSGRMMAGAVDDNFAKIPDGTESEASKEMGDHLGLTEEMKKKYAPGKFSGLDLIKPNAQAPK